MILCPLLHADRYVGLHALFPRALAFARDSTHLALPDGRIALHGEDLAVIVEHGTTVDPSAKRFEGHRRYIDIQVAVQGGEIMEWTPVTGLTTTQDFHPDHGGGDVRFFAEPATKTRLLVPPGHLAIFWPEDAHKPCCQIVAPAPYRKLVFKVAVHPRE